MTVTARFKKTAIVGILVLSAAGLSACGSDKRNCVPNASGPASIERVSSIQDDTSAAFVPLRGGGGGGGGKGGGGGSRGGSSSSKGGSTSSGSSSTKKHTSGSTGFWFFGGGGSKSCPAGQHLK